MLDIRPRDLAGVGIAAFLTGVAIAFIATNRPIPTPEPEVIPVAPYVCVRALDSIADHRAAVAEVVKVSNRVGPLVADAYAAGLAGDDPMIDRVTNLNMRLKEASRAADKVNERYARQAARCRALSEAPG